MRQPPILIPPAASAPGPPRRDPDPPPSPGSAPDRTGAVNPFGDGPKTLPGAYGIGRSPGNGLRCRKLLLPVFRQPGRKMPLDRQLRAAASGRWRAADPRRGTDPGCGDRLRRRAQKRRGRGGRRDLLRGSGGGNGGDGGNDLGPAGREQDQDQQKAQKRVCFGHVHHPFFPVVMPENGKNIPAARPAD